MAKAGIINKRSNCNYMKFVEETLTPKKRNKFVEETGHRKSRARKKTE